MCHVYIALIPLTVEYTAIAVMFYRYSGYIALLIP